MITAYTIVLTVNKFWPNGSVCNLFAPAWRSIHHREVDPAPAG